MFGLLTLELLSDPFHLLWLTVSTNFFSFYFSIATQPTTSSVSVLSGLSRIFPFLSLAHTLPHTHTHPLSLTMSLSTLYNPINTMSSSEAALQLQHQHHRSPSPNSLLLFDVPLSSIFNSPSSCLPITTTVSRPRPLSFLDHGSFSPASQSSYLPGHDSKIGNLSSPSAYSLYCSSIPLHPSSSSSPRSTSQSEGTHTNSIYKRKLRSKEDRTCKSCGRSQTPQWRRGPDGRKSLCNACGLHFHRILQREKQLIARPPSPIPFVSPMNLQSILNWCVHCWIVTCTLSFKLFAVLYIVMVRWSFLDISLELGSKYFPFHP